MSEGPTVVGSIVARLRIDKSDWDRKRAEAQQEAEKLGRTSPNIRIDATVGDALSKMAAVNAAETKLDIANQALRLSYLRLDEAQTKGGVSATRLAALHLAAARAENTHQSATEKLAAAQLALSAAEDEEEHSESRANATHGMTVSRMGLIIAAVAALIPLLAPLAGYAVGVAGALAGMGAAGVLAIIGIKNAMEQGNATGLQYSAGLQNLKGDLNGLASTSANAMLGSFQKALNLINADMPSLNSQIGVFSSMLGNVGTTLLGGVLNTFKVLNPLFVQAGQYVQDLANGFKKWTENGGLQKFGNYAQQVLPKVADTLGSLAAGALHLVEALAPVGTVILGGLKAFGDVLNAIPADLLANLAAGGGAFFLAFKGWAALTPIIQGVAVAIGAVGAAEDLALGPIGLVVAGVTAAAAIFAVSATKTNTAAVAINGYTSAVQQDTGAIGENVRAHAAKALADAGAVDGAKRLGISNKILLDATLGVASAQDVVNQKIKAAKATYDNHGGVIQVVSKKQTEMFDAVSRVSKAVKTNSGEIGDARANYQAYTAVMGESSQQTDVLGRSAATAGAAIDALAQKISGFGQVNLSATQAQVAFQQSVSDATAAVEKNGATLDLSTQAGRDNTTALDGIATSTISLVAAQAKAGEQQATLTGSMQTGRDAFIAAAEAAGQTADQASALADKYGLIPSTVTTAIQTTGAENAIDVANRVAAAVAGIQRNIDIAISAHGATNLATTGGLRVLTNAAGGTINGPGSSTSDSILSWVSDGEEITSNASGQASKYRSLLKAINANAPAERVAAIAGRISASPAGFVTTRSAPAAVHVSNTTSTAPDRPIYMEGGTLFGVIREMANGEARLVVNSALAQQGTSLANGVRPLA